MFDKHKKQHQVKYSQNFLINPRLAKYVVGLSKINETDTILEIGPGRGMLTEVLLERTKNLIVVEKDSALVRDLREAHKNDTGIKIHQADILDFNLPACQYKVFANPPFNILSQIVKKFALSQRSPQEMYLFMQAEAYDRLSAKEEPSQFSTLIKSLYTTKVLHSFARDDFRPVPSVDVQLISFHKKDDVIKPADKQTYILFVQFGWQQQKPSLKKNFEDVFTHEQWKRLAKALKFPIDCQPTELTVTQWLGLFDYFINSVSEEKKRFITSFRPRSS